MRILILSLFLLLSGCSYFSQPDAEHFEYEESTSMCARVLEYPDRIVILYVDCQKAPGAKRVEYFGQGVGDGD